MVFIIPGWGDDSGRSPSTAPARWSSWPSARRRKPRPRQFHPPRRAQQKFHKLTRRREPNRLHV